MSKVRNFNEWDMEERVNSLEQHTYGPLARRTDIAPDFSTEEAYAEDDVVYYNGILYKFTTDHAAGAWNSEEVEETTIAENLGYELPIASAETLGGVKVGNGLSIDAETGELSSSGSDVSLGYGLYKRASNSNICSRVGREMGASAYGLPADLTHGADSYVFKFQPSTPVSIPGNAKFRLTVRAQTGTNYFTNYVFDVDPTFISGGEANTTKWGHMGAIAVIDNDPSTTPVTQFLRFCQAKFQISIDTDGNCSIYSMTFTIYRLALGSTPAFVIEEGIPTIYLKYQQIGGEGGIDLT